MSRLQVLEERVLSKLFKLDVIKSCNLDEMHPYLLKELAHEIISALTNLFNLISETTNVLDNWRCAAVFSIFKKGTKNVAEIHRPISFTSIVCKILKCLVKEDIMLYLLENNLRSSKHFAPFETGLLSSNCCLTLTTVL